MRREKRERERGRKKVRFEQSLPLPRFEILMCVPRVGGAFFSGGLSSSESNLLAGGGPGATVSSVSLLTTCILPPEEGELCLAGEDTGDDLRKRSSRLDSRVRTKRRGKRGRRRNGEKPTNNSPESKIECFPLRFRTGGRR